MHNQPWTRTLVNEASFVINASSSVQFTRDSCNATSWASWRLLMHSELSLIFLFFLGHSSSTHNTKESFLLRRTVRPFFFLRCGTFASSRSLLRGFFFSADLNFNGGLVFPCPAFRFRQRSFSAARAFSTEIRLGGIR